LPYPAGRGRLGNRLAAEAEHDQRAKAMAQLKLRWCGHCHPAFKVSAEKDRQLVANAGQARSYLEIGTLHYN
jgi:cytochrome c553